MIDGRPDIENNGLVYLRGGMARQRTWYLDGAEYQWRCRYCNQLRGQEYDPKRCYAAPHSKWIGEDDTSMWAAAAAANLSQGRVPPPHEHSFLPPFRIDVPLTLTNSRSAEYRLTGEYTKSGLRIYSYSGKRGWRVTPKELREMRRGKP